MRYSSAIDLVYSIKARLADRNFDVDALFKQAGLDEGDCIADDALTLSDKLSHLWELVMQVSDDALIGLKVSSPQPLDRSGLMGHILRASPDVKSAIENLVRYTPLVSPAIQSTIEHVPGRTRVGLFLQGRQRSSPQQYYDFVWCMVLRTIQCAASRNDLKPVLVTYAFPKPELPHVAQAYTEAFGCPVRFGMPANAMEFDNADLSVPITTARPMAADWALNMLAELAQSQRDWTRRMLAKMEQTQRSGPSISFSSKVQQLLSGMLPKGEPLREDVAKQLRMSERTLQRRLAEEGTNFTKLVDDTRRELAHQYLSKGELSLKKMSFQLGFSEPSAFCRACKRWFGRSPKQLQQGAALLETGVAPSPHHAAHAHRRKDAHDSEVFATWSE